MVSGATVKREKLTSYYAKDDYFFSHREDNVNVLGSGAKIFGFDRLRVPIREAFSRLVESREVKAFDLTLSPPKSLSILFAAGNKTCREIAVAVQEKASADLLTYIEEQGFFQAVKKEHGVKRSYPAKGMLVLPIKHSLSRNNDPLLHSHCLIANAGIILGEDRVRALDFHIFFRNQKHFDHVYKSFLRAGLEQKGFTTRTTKDGFELAAITRRQIEVFSSRSQQIHLNLAQMGLTRDTASAKQRQAACLQGRKRKENLDPFRLQEAWSMIALGLGIRLHQVPGKEELKKPIDAHKEIITLALNECLETRATATRKELVDFVLQYANRGADNRGDLAARTLSAADICKQLYTLLKERSMIRLPGQRAPEGDYLTEKLISVRHLHAEQSAPEYWDGLPKDSPSGLFRAGVQVEREGSEWVNRLAMIVQNRNQREAQIQVRRKALADTYGMFSKAPKPERNCVNAAQTDSREVFHADLQQCDLDRPSDGFLSTLEKMAAKKLDAWLKQTRKETKKFAADTSRARFTNHYRRQNKLDSQLAGQLESLQAPRGLKPEVIRVLADLEEIKQRNPAQEFHTTPKDVDPSVAQQNEPFANMQIPDTEDGTNDENEDYFGPR